MVSSKHTGEHDIMPPFLMSLVLVAYFFMRPGFPGRGFVTPGFLYDEVSTGGVCLGFWCFVSGDVLIYKF